MKNLSEYVQRDSSGNVDVKATLNAAKTDLLEFVQREGSANESIVAALDTVLADKAGVRLNKAYVVSHAADILAGDDTETQPKFVASIMTFLKTSPLYAAPKGRSELGFHKVAQDQAAE